MAYIVQLMQYELNSSKRNTIVGCTRSINLNWRLISFWIRNAFQNNPDQQRFYVFFAILIKRNVLDINNLHASFATQRILHFVRSRTVFSKNINSSYVSFHMWFYYWKNQINRSSHQRCSIEKSVLKNFTNFTGKYLCQSLFLNKNLQLYQKRDSRPGVFLWILWNS